MLAVAAGALRRWLRGRGIKTQGLELRALVPVSLRTEEERGMFGNRLAVFRAPLPVYAEDPIERLRIVREEMGKIKQSKQVMGAEAIVALNDFAPPTVLAQASRLNFSTRLFNLIVTNVPGPQFPLYVLGRELETVVPVAFLPEKHALAIAIFSYNGKMSFGLLGDFDAMEDIDVVKEGLEASLRELAMRLRRSGPDDATAAPPRAAALSRRDHQMPRFRTDARRGGGLRNGSPTCATRTRSSRDTPWRCGRGSGDRDARLGCRSTCWSSGSWDIRDTRRPASERRRGWCAGAGVAVAHRTGRARLRGREKCDRGQARRRCSEGGASTVAAGRAWRSADATAIVVDDGIATGYTFAAALAIVAPGSRTG